MRFSAPQCQLTLGLMTWCFLLGFTTWTIGDGTPNDKGRAGKKAAKPLQLKTLTPLLKSPSEQLWEKGLAKVTSESLEDDQIVDAVIQFVERETKARRFSSPLARAITLLGEAKQPQASETIIPLLGSDDFRVAMITADIASSTQNRELIGPIMRLADRPEFALHYGFRRGVIDAVARYRDKSAIDFLVKRLGSSDGQLKYEIAMSLQRATGKDFGGKSDDWQKWWNSNRDNFVFSRLDISPSVALKEPPRQIPWDETRPNFYGMTIYAKRVVFVIDRSGSMKTEVDGVTRLQRAQLEMQQAIQALTETDSFNVVAFDDAMEVFQQRLVPATESNKLDGIRFAYGLTPRSGTACYEPLKMALEASNDLELILFVSDGEPTAGALVDPTAIVVAISNHNLTQRTTINTLGIDARGPHEKFLKDLAEKNGGKLLLVR